MRLGSVSGSCLKASAAPDEWTGLESVMASVYMVAEPWVLMTSPREVVESDQVRGPLRMEP